MARTGRSTAILLGAGTLVACAALPGVRRVAGSVPVPLPGAPPPLVALLESQGEIHAAAAVLAADSTSRDEREARRARLRLASRERRDADALAELDRPPACVPPDEAALLRAVLQARLGAPERALEALASSPAPAELAGYAALLEAEAAAALGRWDVARGAAERAAGAALPQELQDRTLVVRGLAVRSLGDVATLRRLAPELGDAARRDDRTGLLLFALAQECRRAGDLEATREFLLALLAARPTPAESAYAALATVLEPDAPAAIALRVARYEMQSGRGALARERLARAIERTRTASDRAELRVAVADSWLRGGDPTRALAVLERAAADARGTRVEPERLRLRARALKRLDRRDEARRVYRELARRYPNHHIADDALFEVGWMFETTGRLAPAERAYVRCRRTYPAAPLADDSELRAGLCAWRDGRPSAAAAHFAALVERAPRSSLVDNALYWRFLCQTTLGDTAGARATRARLEQEFPRSYFTFLARRRIEPAPAPAPGEPPAAASLQADTPDAGMARARRAHAAYDSALAVLRRAGWQVPEDFAARTRLWRFFLDYGLDVEATWEARRLERVYEAAPGALVEMVAWMHARGSHARLVRVAFLLGQRASDPALGPALDVLAFPAPHAPTLAAAASALGLAHAMVLGLMRQESAFDPRIDSGAGARGLMQLMPEVGRRLARDAGLAGFTIDDLYRPEVNIDFGCRLLAAELRQASGDLLQALAAYNAGADVAAAWAGRLLPRDPPETYIDLAEYAETRNYLKTVLGNLETYRRLYGLP